jgi:uncharacterized protein (TIGR03437 family)
LIRSRGRILAVISYLIAACISAFGQITIDTFAGGHIRSGVSAQNVAFGFITGITRDPKGDLVFCDSSNNVIRRIQADGIIQTIAGLGIPGYSGDGKAATRALLSNPAFPKYDAAGNLYFADVDNFRIRRIDTSGVISTVAGTGIPGTLGGDGPATQAQIDYVTDLAIDKAGYVYFAEYLRTNLRRLTPSGQIKVYAACSTCGRSMPTTLATDPAGNLYMSNGSQIFRITPDGVMHDFAGFGSAANNGNGGPALNAPPSDFIALAADSAGDLYTEEVNPLYAESGPFVIRRIGTNGVINIVAGTFTGSSQSDGPALQTQLNSSAGLGLTADPIGTVTFPEDYRIRQLTAQATIQTIAANTPQPAPDGTTALSAWFIGPTSIAFDRAGELYIGQDCIIQKIDSRGLLSKVAGTGQCSNTPPSGPALTTELDVVVSIAVDSQDQIYFADLYGSVYIVSTKGVISKMVTVPEGVFPAIAVDSQDRLYFLTASGIFGRIVPGSAPQYINMIAGTLNGRGIAIDAADNVYICCDLSGGVDRYSPNLDFTRLGLRGGDGGIAIDSSSNIWQGTTAMGLTKGTLPFGSGCCNYGDGGPAESAYISPSALAFAPNGDLYVLEYGTNSVRRIRGSPPAVAPSISAVGIVNAASYAGTAIAPGELISIFGSNFGPTELDNSTLQNNFVPATLNNVHVYFGATEPALEGRIAARTADQVNVFVPYSVSGANSSQVIVDVDGVTSTPVTVPVAASAFGIATANASGSGQGAIRNQDGSLNNHSNPAPPGSIVTFYGTGEGVTTPALPDGALVISTPYPTTQAPITVKFGDKTAKIQYAGGAPFLPTGIFQINAFIPTGLAPGDVPITVSIAGISTTRTVTVAIQ